MAAEFPHLPPGREPGRQSRSRRTGARIWVVLLILLGLFFIGLGVAGAADPGEAAPWVFLAVFVPMAAASFAAAWFIRRRARGVLRTSKDFEVSVEPITVRWGEELQARLRVLDPEGVGERVEVGLVCTELYDHEQVSHNPNGGTTRSRETAEATAHEEWLPADRAQQVQAFRFRIPKEAPFSHEGACLGFAWRVSAREPLRMRSDKASDVPIWVEP